MKQKIANSLRYSFRLSLPILISFIPVGLAYGILMQSAGYGWMWCASCSLFVYAGSLQMLMVSFFPGGISLFSVAVMALLLNARHIFYGVPFIEKWRGYGPWKYFLIYALPDEAFTLHCAAEPGPDCDEKWVYIFNATLVLFYWLALSVLGALIGSLLHIDTAGIDFAMTALFLVILLDGLRNAKSRLPLILAIGSSALGLLFFGADGFILPSLLLTVALLLLLRRHIEPKEEASV